MEDHENGQSLKDLLKTFGHDLQELVRLEAELALKELSEKGRQAKRGAFSLAGGGTAVFAGFIMVLAAASIGLGFILSLFLPVWISAWLAPLTVGGLTMIVGGSAAMRGARSLGPSAFVPHQTLGSLQEDARWIRRSLQ